MKNTTLTISFNSEKLDALTFHMGKRETGLQTELNDTIQKLYEKYVPQTTREYIDDKISRETDTKNRSSRPARSTAASDQPEQMGGSDGGQRP